MFEEISVKDLGGIKEDYKIIDIRDEIAFRYGSIPGAVNIPQKEIETNLGKFDSDTIYIIMCKSGIISDTVASELREKGIFASASRDSATGKVFIKLVNTTETGLRIPLEIEGVKAAKITGSYICGNPSAYNSTDNTGNISVRRYEAEFDGSVSLEAYSVNVLEIEPSKAVKEKKKAGKK